MFSCKVLLKYFVPRMMPGQETSTVCCVKCTVSFAFCKVVCCRLTSSLLCTVNCTVQQCGAALSVTGIDEVVPDLTWKQKGQHTLGCRADLCYDGDSPVEICMSE